MSEATRLRSGLLVFPNLTQLDLTGRASATARSGSPAPPRLCEGQAPVFESGVTIVNNPLGQPDQKKVIECYANSVLPKIGNTLLAAESVGSTA